jgi:hypothetical protein
MVIQKLSFLQRSRIVFTALVILAGLGSTLIAMKPAQKMAAYTYGVAETSGGTHFQVIRNITGESGENWVCDLSPNVCTVTSDEIPSPDGLISVANAQIQSEGDFAEVSPFQQAKHSLMKSLKLLIGVLGISKHYYQLSGCVRSGWWRLGLTHFNLIRI